MPKWVLLLILLLVAVTLVPEPTLQAQDDNPTACNTLIQEALSKVANVCLGLGTNEVCYGNELVSATLTDDSYFFEAVGDIVPVDALDTVITRPANPDTGEWGIVLMDLQADLPTDSAGAVRLLLYGGVEIAPQIPATITSNCSVRNDDSNVNLRSGPGTEYRTVDVLDRGTAIAVDGRNADGEWLHTERGWLASWVVTATCTIEDLPVLGEEAVAAPARDIPAFTVQMDDNARCQAAPSGLLIQSPSGQTANLRINNVDLSIGSTAYLTMRNGNRQLNITNLEGNVRVTARGVTRDIRPGRQSRVRFDEAGNTSEPSEPTLPDQETLMVEFDVIDDLIDTEYFLDTALEICFDEDGYDPYCLDAVFGSFEDLSDICYDAVLDEYDETCLDELDNWFEDPAETCYDPETDTYDEDCLDEIFDSYEFDDPLDFCYDPETDTYDEDCLIDYDDTTFDLCYDPETDSYDEDCLDEVLEEDIDGDGVSDLFDFCPDLPGPPEFDGCPLEEDGDLDGDGILDFDDFCPELPGPPENDGCPDDDDEDIDSDGDGLTDDVDFCPFDFGPPENDGCPDDDEDIDSDGDGLTDDEDFCPFDFGPPENDGCPDDNEDIDSDGDGLTDDEDFCPYEYGPADNGGCPILDSDGDGLTDDEDFCPYEYGPADNGGCPILDSDGDGLTDDEDFCPYEYGPADNGGCPIEEDDI